MYGFRLPEDFLIGTANSAFQSEGAMDRDGKSENIMEYFAREYAGIYSPGIAKKIKAGIMKSGRLLAVGTVAELNTMAGTDDFETAFVTIVKEGMV